MLKLKNIVLIVLIVLFGFSGSRCLADLFVWDGNPIIGDLTYDTTINADGLWGVEGTSFSYAVTRPGGDTGPLHYSYTFTIPDGTQDALSHLIIEVSSEITGGELGEFTLAHPDYFNFTLEADEMQTFNPGSGNPGLPVDIFGIKYQDNFTNDETYSWTVQFDSWRNPMDGSFYAKGGDNSYAYNTGLGGGGAFIPVPDTSYVPVPGAVILGILGLGVAGIKLRKYT